MTRAGYKKHFRVIDWFYNQPEGTTVLEKNRILEIWKEVEDPIFSVENDYLINDGYVEFRKAIYEGKIVECISSATGKWIPINFGDSYPNFSGFNEPNIAFICPIDAYRVKQDIEFPIYKKNDFMVVKFVNEKDCEVLFIFDEDKASEFAEIGMLINDENVNDKQWEDVLYDKEKELWDGQPVWCYDKDYETIKSLGFYDAKHNRLFDVIGSRCGNIYDNYKPYPHLTDDWVIEAYNKLKF